MRHINMIAESKGEKVDDNKKLDQYLEWVLLSLDEMTEEEKVPKKETLV